VKEDDLGWGHPKNRNVENIYLLTPWHTIDSVTVVKTDAARNLQFLTHFSSAGSS
jgi:hypothetical protein